MEQTKWETLLRKTVTLMELGNHSRKKNGNRKMEAGGCCFSSNKMSLKSSWLRGLWRAPRVKALAMKA